MNPTTPYRCLFLDMTRRVVRGDMIEARDDAEAIRLVRAANHADDCEIWQFTRQIALVPREGGLPILPYR